MAAKPDKTTEKSAPPKRRIGLWIGGLVVVLASAGTAAGWYFTRPAATEDAKQAEVAAKRADTIFMPLEPFTVNLADEGGERLAQVAIVLELEGKAAQAALSKYLPIVRNSMLLLLSSQYTKTLLTTEGKLALASQIALKTGTVIGWKPQAVEVAQAGVTADGKPAEATATDAARPVSPARSEFEKNPVVAVHFSQLLVQ
jgi:flagellar FliL protein